MLMSPSVPVPDPRPEKKLPSKKEKLLRLILSILDPRAWAHAAKLINYYNYGHVQPRRKLSIGPGAAISPNAIFSNPEQISAGANLFLGARCHLWAGPKHGRITIGDNVLFGPGVMVTAANYRFNDGQPVVQQEMKEADIVIGNDVWIATGAVILPGVTIGDGAIIGAGTVVNRDIPALAIAVGAPVRTVGTRQIIEMPDTG